MRIGLFWARRPAPRRGYARAGRLAGVWALAFSLFLAAGASQAQAAGALPGAAGSLAFTAPSYSGVIGGPPGTKVTVHGSSWLAYSSVALGLTDQAKNCNGAVSIGTFPTTSSGTVTASFNWPAEANHVGAYYVCGTQANKGTFFSRNTFSLLSNSPASLSFTPTAVAAGDRITLSGSNWLPAPQTINIVVVPCKSICAQPPVAQLVVVTGADGTFSQSVTISSSAATNGYYAQATNSLAAVAAVAGPLQVTGLASPNGTPSAGATSTTRGGVAPPPSNTKAALKDALLAGGLGLVALLVLVGVVSFFLTRSRRGPDLPSKQPQEPGNWDGRPAEDKSASRPGTVRPVDGESAYWEDMPQLPPKRRVPSKPWDDKQSHTAPSGSSAVSRREDVYPWTKRVESRERQRSERAEMSRSESQSAPGNGLALPAQQPSGGIDATQPAQSPPGEYPPRPFRQPRRPGTP